MGIRRSGGLNINKKYLFMIGYDYSYFFKNFKSDDFYVLLPADDSFIGEDIKDKFDNIFSDRLFFVEYGTDEIYNVVKKIAPNVLITLGWRRIIDKTILNLVDLAVNVHPAILPQYRGYHPVPYVLINNEQEHGVTAHIIEETLDSGKIILQKKFGINQFSTLKSLQYQANNIMPKFLKELINKIDTDGFIFKENDLSKTKIIAKRRIPEDSEIDPEKKLNDIYNEIRACDENRFPAFFYRDGEKIYIKLYRKKKSYEKNCIHDL